MKLSAYVLAALLLASPALAQKGTPAPAQPAQECITYEQASQRLPREVRQIRELTGAEAEQFAQTAVRVLGSPAIPVDRVVFWGLEDTVVIAGFRGGCLVASGIVPVQVYQRLVPST